MASWWQSYIARRARALGLDPRAVLAVASQEGLSGGVGDSGHAFGPFQMNDAGGVLTGRPGNHRAFAESRAGIDYALRGIAGVARGQRGGQAVSSIVSRYERPKDPRSEIAGALRSYGGGSSGAPLALPTASPTGQATPGPDSTSLRANVLSSLIAASQETGQHRTPDYTPVFAAIAQLRQGGHAPNSPARPVPVLAQAGVSSGTAGKAISTAQQYLGTPYRWGGANPRSGFDCSGLLQWSWGRAGVQIPRTSQQQWRAGNAVGRGQLRAGDAVFFEAGASGPGHVGMMVDRNHFIESPHTGAAVRVSSLAGRSDYVGARRFG